MLKSLEKLLKYLKQWEFYDCSSFQFYTIDLYLSFCSGFGTFFSQSPTQSQIIIKQVRGGAAPDYLLVGKRKKFNLAFHRRLEQHFLDWKELMAYQEKQAEFYKLAMRKKREIIKLRIRDDFSLYSEKELQLYSINYFEGKGYYARCQDSSIAPNIFDTRQSFYFTNSAQNLHGYYLKFYAAHFNINNL